MVIVPQPLAANLHLDGHDDLSVYLRYAYNNDIHGDNFTARFERGGLGQHVDLARWKDGKVGGTFWVAFTFCPENSLDFSDENYRESMNLSLHGLLEFLSPSLLRCFGWHMTSICALHPGRIHGRFIYCYVWLAYQVRA